jgi:hypothetical protein
MIDLDEKRQHNREALTHLVKKPKLADSKLWYNQGTLFLKMPGNDIANYIREGSRCSHVKHCFRSFFFLFFFGIVSQAFGYRSKEHR